MSAWTHSICEHCWLKRERARIPVRITHAEEVRCCFCGDWTASGIFVRHRPEELRCRGAHDR